MPRTRGIDNPVHGLSRRGFFTAGAAGVAATSLAACFRTSGTDGTAERPALTRPEDVHDDAWAHVRAQFIIEPGTAYGARWNQADIRVSRTFDVDGGRIQAMFDVYNVLNENAVIEEDRNYGPNYLRPTAIMPGRLAKFALQFNF